MAEQEVLGDERLAIALQFNPVSERIAHYPIGQQIYTMSRRPAEGPIQGDDSVECRDNSAIVLNMDVTLFWRVDPNEIADLYKKWGDQPLSGGGDLNKGISNLVVRRLARGDINQACGFYSWQDIFGQQREEYRQRVFETLKNDMDQEHLLLDQLKIGEVYPTRRSPNRSKRPPRRGRMPSPRRPALTRRATTP